MVKLFSLKDISKQIPQGIEFEIDDSDAAILVAVEAARRVEEPARRPLTRRIPYRRSPSSDSLTTDSE